MSATTSSAPAIWGTRSGRTKLTASTRGKPAAESRSTRDARVPGAKISASFWSPSRGPTSQIVTRMPTSLASADLHPEQARKLRGRACRKRRLPPLLLRRLAGHDRRADEAAADPRQRLGRQARDAPGRERKRRPLVVAAARERGEDLAAEPARADAVAGIAGAEVDVAAWDGAEEGQVVGGHVDGTAPRALDPRVREVGQE